MHYVSKTIYNLSNMIPGKWLFKSVSLILVLFVFVGCAMQARYPDVSHDIPAIHKPLPLDVNLQCVIWTNKGKSQLEGKVFEQLMSQMSAEKLFSSMTSGENQFLTNNQVAVRIDVTIPEDREQHYWNTPRSEVVRWRAWNKSGLLVDKESVFDYDARWTAPWEKTTEWILKITEDAYVELRKNLKESSL